MHGGGDFESLAPALPPAMPDWSPVRHYGGYQGATLAQATPHSPHRTPTRTDQACECMATGHAATITRPRRLRGFWGALGCSCFAF